MRKILITGFDPFANSRINPAREAVFALPDTIPGFEIIKLEVPTVYGLAGEVAADAVKKHSPSMILCVGQAGGRDAITPEMVAINCRYADIADNSGSVMRDVPVVCGGPAAYFATVPVRKMASAIVSAGLPGKVSYSAGTFVCNDLFYSLLHKFPDIPTGFIHVPFLPEQAGAGVPSLSLSDTVRGLCAAISAAAEDLFKD